MFIFEIIITSHIPYVFIQVLFVTFLIFFSYHSLMNSPHVPVHGGFTVKPIKTDGSLVSLQAQVEV